jgi:hypothetical protein
MSMSAVWRGSPNGFEPPDLTAQRILGGAGDQQRVQRRDQPPESTAHPWELSRRGQDHSEVVGAPDRGRANDRQEIDGILRDEGPVLGRRRPEEGLIAEPAQIRALSSRHDIVPAQPELGGNSRREVLVEEQPHSRTACSRRHAS